MKAELQSFTKDEFGTIKEMQLNNKNEYMGFFYFLEYGNFLKIGCSKQPYTGMQTLKRNAEKYADLKIGRVAISQAHTNYKENKKLIHELFKKSRKQGTELFDLSFDSAFKKVKKYEKLEYLDETTRMQMEQTNFCNMMKNFLEGGDF